MMRRTFQTLDGLRGVAAIFVVLFHMHNMFPVIWRPPSAYLAVDLFFALSGFVLAEAYSARLDNGFSVYDFMRLRLFRLWPLYALGIMIAAGPFLIGMEKHRLSLLGLAPVLANLLYIPWPGRHGELYPLNLPAWSLLFELLANFIMAACWKWLSNAVLAGIVLISAIGLLVTSSVFGSLDAGFDLSTVAGAPARIGFSFFLGILIWRIKPSPSRISAWVTVIAAIVILSLGGARIPRCVLDPVLVILISPWIVWLSAASSPSPRSKLVFVALGKISYALYAIHLPMLALEIAVFAKFAPELAAKDPMVTALGILINIGFIAWFFSAFDVWIRTRGAFRKYAFTTSPLT